MQPPPLQKQAVLRTYFPASHRSSAFASVLHTAFWSGSHGSPITATLSSHTALPVASTTQAFGPRHVRRRRIFPSVHATTDLPSTLHADESARQASPSLPFVASQSIA